MRQVKSENSRSYRSNHETLKSENLTFTNCFDSSSATAPAKPKPKALTKKSYFNLSEVQRLRYKQSLSKSLVDALRRSTDKEVLGQAERIEACCSDENLFSASDLHTQDGELFAGKGSLWSCNCRACPNCVGKLSKTNRKIMRFVMENEKLLLGESWFFPTFTMPKLPNLELPEITALFQTAWKRFTASEAKGKRKTWFQKNVRGGFKNCEFTLGESDNAFHFHAHGLIIAKSRIQNDKFFEIRREWTKALKHAFEKHSQTWNCPTGNKAFIPSLFAFMLSKPKACLLLNALNETKFFGLANVNVVKITAANREQTISELCKYVTKTDSWQNIPIQQLERIIKIPRFGRMFESFGCCRQTARKMSERQTDSQTEKPVENKANASKDANLDTNNLINRQENHKKTLRRASWRIRVKKMPFEQFKAELKEEIRAVQRFRKVQLQQKYMFASFETLSGQKFGRNPFYFEPNEAPEQAQMSH